MKWVGLLILLAAVPAIYTTLRGSPHLAPRIWVIFGFSAFISSGANMDVAVISWAGWPGYSKGIELSIIDAFALAIVLAAPKLPPKFPLLWLWLLSAGITFSTALFSNMPMAALFVCWQILRVTLVFCAATIVCFQGGGRSILTGLVLGLALNAGIAVHQYLSGALQARGLFAHQNSLGLASHFVAFPAFALFLSGARSRWIAGIGIVAALVVAIVGVSRATIGFAALGYASTLALSLIRKPTARKWSVAGLSVLSLVIIVPAAYSTLERRLEATIVGGDYDERAAFEKAAFAMFSDHPFGVGANQYVVTANRDGYSARAGVIWNFGSRAAHVHNVYALTLAETGFLGASAFTLLLVIPIVMGIRMAWRQRGGGAGDWLIGYVVALIVVALHNLYEWVFVTYSLQILFAISVACIAAHSLEVSRKAGRRQGVTGKSHRYQNAIN